MIFSTILVFFSAQQISVLLLSVIMAWCDPPTIVQVAEVACVEEEVSPEKVSKATFAWPERQRCVEVQTTCPVGLSTQIIT